MKRKTAESLAFLGIVIMVLGLFFYLSPLKFSQNDTTELDPQRGVAISSHRDKGERVEGYFTVRWGNEEVEFSIKDPYGVIIYNAGTVKSRHDFAFTTEHDGIYTLAFYNRQDTSKTVFLTEQRTFTRGLDLALVGIGIGLLIMGLAGFYEEKLRQSSRKVEQPPPPPSNPQQPST